MPQNIRRRLFGRIVLWDTKGGTIIDLPSRNVLSFGGPSESEQYVRLASGDREVVSRSHTAQIPISSVRETEIIQVLQRNKSKVKALFLGINGTDNFIWLEPTRIQVTEPEVSPGSIGRKVAQLDTNVFYPSIWEGMSIIEGVPWLGTEQSKRGSKNVLRHKNGIRPGYKGPLWEVPSGASVDLGGSITSISEQNPATLKWEFPVGGIKLKIVSDGAFSGSLYALNENDSEISSSNISRTLVTPSGTKKLKLELEKSNSKVGVVVKEIGNPVGVIS
jgi:hypothetical protein